MKMVKNILKLGVLTVLASSFAFANGSKEGGDTIKIGGILPLSGAVAVYGNQSQMGIQLAIEEINAAGGIDGKKLELICEDDEGNPDKSVNAFKKLSAKDGVKFIIGSCTSGCTKALTTFAQAQKTILITPSATNYNITDAGNYIFRACFIDPFQGLVGAKFAYDTLKVRKAAVLYDIGNDYCAGLQENFQKTFKSYGGEIVLVESYATGDKDFNAQLTKIKNVNPDLVYLPDYYGTVALIATQLRAQGITCPILGGDGWDGLDTNAGDEVLNGYYSNHFASDSTSAAVQSFVKAFSAKYGKVPNSFAALGYDCMYLIRDGIVNAGSVDTEKVSAAMGSTNGDYVTGHLTFDSHRDPLKSAVILEMVKGSNGALTTAYKTTINP